MCKHCLAAVDKHFPGLSLRDKYELLWSATAYPFPTPRKVDEQLAEHVAAGATTVEAACARADQQTEAAMWELNLRRAFPGWGWEPPE